MVALVTVVNMTHVAYEGMNVGVAVLPTSSQLVSSLDRFSKAMYSGVPNTSGSVESVTKETRRKECAGMVRYRENKQTRDGLMGGA